ATFTTTGAGTVTLTAAISASTVTFNGGGYTLANDGTVSNALTATSVTVTGSSTTLTLGSSNATGGVLGNTGGVTLSAGGTLSTVGTAAATHLGTGSLSYSSSS